MASAGTLWVNVAARTNKLTKGLTSARSQINKFGKLAFGGLAAGATAAGAAAAATFAQMAPRIDSVSKAADRLAISTEALSALGHAASLSGASVATLDKSLTIMLRNVGESKAGIGPAAEALERLKLNAAELSGLSADQSFIRIADAISKLPTAADRTSSAMDIFGKSGAKLLPLMNQGARGIRGMMRDAERLGNTFTRAQGRMVAEAVDSITRITAAIDGLKNQLTIALAPAVTVVSEKFASWVASMNDGAGAASKMMGGMRTLAMAAGKVADVVHSIRLGFVKLQEVITRVIGWIVTKMADLMTIVINLVNKIPGITQSGPPELLQAQAAAIQQEADRLGKVYQRMLLAPPPSEKIDRFFEKIERRAEMAAAKVNEAVQNAVLPTQVEILLKKFGDGIAGAGVLMGKVVAAGVGAISGPGRPAMSPALALTRAGTPESYRQRQAILRQNDGMKVAREHLQVAKRQEGWLKQIAGAAGNLLPANLFK